MLCRSSCLLLVAVAGALISQSNSQDAKRVLVILTSHDQLGDTGLLTGWYLPELAHPYKMLLDAGIAMDAISPKGGKAPLDPQSAIDYKDDPICQWFQNDTVAQDFVDNTMTPDQINPGDYDAIFFPGGHGPMFDLAFDDEIAAITATVFEQGGVVSAVCHGPAGLVPVKLSNGDALVKGRSVTSFSNAEETEVQLTDVVPFLLESKLVELGGIYTAAPNWNSHVIVDGQLITGQNPQSAEDFGHALLAKLQ